MAKRRRPATPQDRRDSTAPDETMSTAALPSFVPDKRQPAHPLATDDAAADVVIDPAPITAPSLSAARALSARSLPRPEAADAGAPHADGLGSGRLPQPMRLSGPRSGRANVQTCVAELRAALEEGWEIVQPIFARPLWSVTDDSATAFNFVLRRERATRLVTVPEGRGVQRFIRDHHLAVDYRQ